MRHEKHTIDRIAVILCKNIINRKFVAVECLDYHFLLDYGIRPETFQTINEIAAA
jgi:hypothetical protein